MIIKGADYHPGFQQIAFVDTETGDCREERLEHCRGAEKFYRLKPPASDADTRAWLRPKGIRDIAAGLIVLAMMLTADRHLVGIALLVEAIIPLGDMSIVLGSGGSKSRAFSIFCKSSEITYTARSYGRDPALAGKRAGSFWRVAHSVRLSP